MKKVIVLILVSAMVAVVFAGCGNMSLGVGNFNYKKIHIDTHHYSGCLTVKKWYENSSGVEVLTEEAGSVFASEGTYIMLGGDKECPFCGGKERQCG